MGLGSLEEDLVLTSKTHKPSRPMDGYDFPDAITICVTRNNVSK
jgi:hypothetical protein